MPRILIAFSLAAASAGVGAKPNKTPKPPLAETCSAVYVVDAKTKVVLEDKNNNSHQELPLASLTKIFTASVIMRTGSPDQILNLDVPTHITPNQFARYESCQAPRFGPPHTIPRQISLSEAVIALIATSHNPLAYKLGEEIASPESGKNYTAVVKDFLATLGLPTSDLHIVNNDPSGMIGAQSCSRAKLPPRLRGNQGSPALITDAWAWLVQTLGPKIDLLKNKTVTFLDAELTNTNPFQHYNTPEITVVGKTGALSGVSNFTGTATNSSRSIHFTLICPSSQSRKAEGNRILQEYILHKPALGAP